MVNHIQVAGGLMLSMLPERFLQQQNLSHTGSDFNTLDQTDH